VPKQREILDFFPALDESQNNPSCTVEMEVVELQTLVAARYIHYNGRRTGSSTRDEYRLTGIARALRLLGAQSGDQLCFETGVSGDIAIHLVSATAPESDFGEIPDRVQLASGWILTIK